MLLTNPAGAQMSGESFLAGVKGVFLAPQGVRHYERCGLDDKAIRVAQAQPFREGVSLPTGPSFHTTYFMTVDCLNGVARKWRRANLLSRHHI